MFTNCAQKSFFQPISYEKEKFHLTEELTGHKHVKATALQKHPPNNPYKRNAKNTKSFFFEIRKKRDQRFLRTEKGTNIEKLDVQNALNEIQQ